MNCSDFITEAEKYAPTAHARIHYITARLSPTVAVTHALLVSRRISGLKKLKADIIAALIDETKRAGRNTPQQTSLFSEPAEQMVLPRIRRSP